MIAEALVPVFFVMVLGYFAGARRIIDNQQVASLNALGSTVTLSSLLSVIALSAAILLTSHMK
jgi:malonate transporter